MIQFAALLPSMRGVCLSLPPTVLTVHSSAEQLCHKSDLPQGTSMVQHLLFMRVSSFQMLREGGRVEGGRREGGREGGERRERGREGEEERE